MTVGFASTGRMWWRKAIFLCCSHGQHGPFKGLSKSVWRIPMFGKVPLEGSRKTCDSGMPYFQTNLFWLNLRTFIQVNAFLAAGKICAFEFKRHHFATAGSGKDTRSHPHARTQKTAAKSQDFANFPGSMPRNGPWGTLFYGNPIYIIYVLSMYTSI